MDPDAFIQTGVYGTYVMLEAAREFGLERYHQISTDEVYGDIPAGYSSVESDPLRPRSPYSASKASGDLLVQSYFTTYELPVTISRGSTTSGLTNIWRKWCRYSPPMLWRINRCPYTAMVGRCVSINTSWIIVKRLI